MKKNFFLIVIVLFAFAVNLFAQNAESLPKLGITDSDIRAFVKNYDKIEEALKKYDSNSAKNDSQILAEVEDILEKNGISGPNRVHKVVAITSGVSYEIAAQRINKEIDAATLKQLQAMGFDPYQAIKQLKAMVHPDDMKVITKNADLYDELYTKIGV